MNSDIKKTESGFEVETTASIFKNHNKAIEKNLVASITPKLEIISRHFIDVENPDFDMPNPDRVKPFNPQIN